MYDNTRLEFNLQSCTTKLIRLELRIRGIATLSDYLKSEFFASKADAGASQYCKSHHVTQNLRRFSFRRFTYPSTIGRFANFVFPLQICSAFKTHLALHLDQQAKRIASYSNPMPTLIKTKVVFYSWSGSRIWGSLLPTFMKVSTLNFARKSSGLITITIRQNLKYPFFRWPIGCSWYS